MEVEGEGAVQSICREHPEHAEEILESLKALDALDLGRPSSAHRREIESPGPDRLGPFRIIRRVGGGGMGVVYLARQERLGRFAAVKVLPPGFGHDPELRSRFEREAAAVAKLEHPAVVKVYDFGEDGGVLYLAMEWVNGPSLADVLARYIGKRPIRAPELAPFLETLGVRSEEDARPHAERSYGRLVRALVRVGIDIADALQSAHAAGLIHRDVKPGNILLDGDGRPRLTDFGLVRSADSRKLTATGQLLGTPGYLAPESIRSGETDHRVDVFGLGVVLYEVLALESPFRGASSAEISQQILHHDPPPLDRLDSRIPRDLSNVILKALEKDREKRYPDAASLRDDLDRFLRGEAVQASRIGLMGRAIRRARRRPALTALSAGLLLALLVAALAILYLLDVKAEERRQVTDRLATARGLREQGHLTRALDAYREVLDLDPGSPEVRREIEEVASLIARRRLLAITIANGHDRETVRWIRREVAGWRAEDWRTPEGALLKAQLEVADDAYARALTVLDEAGPAGNTAALHILRARTLELGNDEDGSARELERARAAPHRTAADLLLEAHVALSEKDLHRAFAWLREGRNRWPDSPHFLYTMGLMLENQHRYQEAIDAFTEASKRDPAYAEPLMHRGYRYLALGELGRAAADFEAALAVRPGYTWAVHGKAEVLHAAGKPEEAMNVVDAALRRDPGHALLLNARGYLHARNGRTEEAVRDLEAAIARDPELPFPYVNLSNVLLRNGRREEARKWLDRALEENLPLAGRIEVLNARATLLWVADPAQTEKDLLAGLEIVRSPLLYGNLALFYLNQYRFAEALPMLSEQMATGYEPELALARRGFCRWMLLDVEGGIRDQDRALEQLADGGSRLDRLAWPYLNRARAAAGAGDLEAALGFAAEAVKRAGRDRVPGFEAFRLRLMAGDTAGVKASLDQFTFDPPYGKLMRAWVLARSGAFEEAFGLLPSPDPGLAAWKWRWPSPLPWLALYCAGRPGGNRRVRMQARAIVAGTADADAVASALSTLEDAEEKCVWRWITGHVLLAAGRAKEALRHLQPASARLTWTQVKLDLAIALALDKQGRKAVEVLRALPFGFRVRCVESMARHGVKAGDPELDDWLRSGVTPMRR